LLPPAQPIGIPTTTADVTIIGGALLLRGWAWIETTGTAAATFDLVDGLDENGQLVVPFSLTAGQSTRDPLIGSGIEIKNGLFLEMLTGSIRGSVWVTPADRYGNYELLVGEHDVYVGEV
jgi:hypothetical protein